MTPNPFLQKLGLSDTDRVVVFHSDDIGMCQGTLTAYRDLVNFGVLSAAATMVPCPWFPAAAAFCREHNAGGKIDMGVHLTLNSEWAGFRWGPISTTDPATGIIDSEGYFYNNTNATQANGDPAAVRRELQAQIERALAAGVDATHIDSHMFGIFHIKFLPVYFDLARHYRLPAFMLRADSVQMREIAVDNPAAAEMTTLLQSVEEEGFPLFDYVHAMSLDPLPDRVANATEILTGLPAGLSYFLFHPCPDTPELRAMAPDWEARVQDYHLFLDEGWRQAVRDSGVHVIGMRTLRDIIRSER